MWKYKMENAIYLYLFFLWFYGVSPQSVTITEDAVYIMNNVVGQVMCKLDGNCGAISWYLSSITAPVATTFIGYSCQNRTTGFYQTCDYSNHQYTLYFTGTTNLHRQTLRCSGEGCTPQQTVSDTATISVIVPVPSLALEGISGQQITVTTGQSISITCVTGSSRPASHILWYIGMTNVTSLSTETQIQSQELFYTRSILTFIPTKSQNRLQLNCKAYNTDNNTAELTTKPTLNVQYPPDDANAMIKQGNTISTIEGNSTTLVCEVKGGNPLATITWDCFGLTGTSSTDRDLSRSTINFIAQRSYDRQTCTCRATHPNVNLGSDSVTINVYYGPASISYQPGITSYTRNEGDNLGPIQCVSDCNPKCNFVWTRTVQSDYNGENLTVSSIMRTQEGDYKCTASNSYGNKSGLKLSVVVNYGPGPVILTPSVNNYIVNETFQLGPIKCFARCKPSCSYKWIRPNQDVIQGDTLTINSIQRTQTGTYECQPYNAVGSRNSNVISVTVFYAAKLTSMVISDGNNFMIPEHSTQTITCLAEGLPQPTMALIYTPNNSIIKSINGLRLDFTFPLARCEDTGIYKCDAINKFTPRVPLEKEVFVLCKPRAATKLLNNQYLVSPGKTLNITVSYIAYPRPTFQWLKKLPSGSTTKIIDRQANVQIKNNALNKNTFVTEFIRKDVKENDFGKYILNTKNEIDTIEDVYMVKPIGKPEPPIGVLATCISYNSAILTWTSGFNNGDNQTFTVVYSEDEIKQISDDIKDPGLYKPILYTVVDLKESRTYAFSIFSRNNYGESRRLNVSCSTTAYHKQEAASDCGLAVGAVLGSAIGLIIVVVILIVLCRRFKTNEGIKETEDMQMEDSNQREYDNLTACNETNIYNVIGSEAAYGNSGDTDKNNLNSETLNTPNEANDNRTYEQIQVGK